MQYTFTGPDSLKRKLDKNKPEEYSRSQYMLILVQNGLKIRALEKRILKSK